MKRIVICIPCYNEEENIKQLVEELQTLFCKHLSKYDCSIMFIDNKSTDSTREKIAAEVEKYNNVKAIFNAKNFPMTSGYYGLLNAGGDCTISIPADFQIPLDIIPRLVKEWEDGGIVVCAVKESTEENHFIWRVRQKFYKVYARLANGEIIKNFTGAGLYDKKFLDVLRSVNDYMPSLMAMIMTHGWGIRKVFYKEASRKKGKTKNNLLSMISIAILRITNASIVIPRISLLLGVAISLFSILSLIIYFFMCLYFGNCFDASIIPILCAVFFMGAIQLIFLGVIGEFVIKINTRLSKRPLVIEEERLGF